MNDDRVMVKPPIVTVGCGYGGCRCGKSCCTCKTHCGSAYCNKKSEDEAKQRNEKIGCLETEIKSRKRELAGLKEKDDGIYS
jgi:hypothetical protein